MWVRTQLKDLVNLEHYAGITPGIGDLRLYSNDRHTDGVLLKECGSEEAAQEELDSLTLALSLGAKLFDLSQ